MIDIKEILDAAGMHPSRAQCVWLFGSRVYGTADESSDWDAIIVGKSSVEAKEIKEGDFNIHVYTPDRWAKDLAWHSPKCLECHFAPEWAVLKKDIDFGLAIDMPKLRHAVSHTSSNSWVKSRKKMDVEGEYRIGVKSLFHSIRIPMFGEQIARAGKIEDFGAANWIWDRISEREWTWEELDREFRKTRQSVMTEFRKLAEKG